jgi:putative heme-binding domain-containing protein
LVAALESPNGWQRDTAQRLLVHAQDKSAVAPLRKLLAASKNPKVRLHALSTLDGLAALGLRDLQRGWRDDHPMVRAHSIRLSESKSINEIINHIAALADDPDIRVRFQLALTLGEPKWPAEKSGPALAAIAARDAADSHVRTAVLSSAPPCVDHLVNALEKWSESRAATLPLRQQLLELSVALKRDESIVALLKPALTGTPSNETFPLINSFLTALRRRALSVDKFAEQSSPPLRQLLRQLPEIGSKAQTVAVDSKCDASQRAAAITALCRLSPSEETAARVADLLLPDQPNAVQKAALTALGELRGSQPAKSIVKLWNQLGPSIRTEAIELLLSRSECTDIFLGAVENNTVPRGHLPAAARQRLTSHRTEGIRKRASAVFDGASSDRLQVVRKYQASMKGDAQRGAALFRQHCATCHHFKGEGVALGPDLATLTDKSPESLLVAILDPNQSVETPFVNYTVTMRDGREFSGIIANETGNSFTLRLAGGSEQVLLRNEIRDLTGSGLSLMPEGLEQALDPRQMADLIEYVLSE